MTAVETPRHNNNHYYCGRQYDPLACFQCPSVRMRALLSSHPREHGGRAYHTGQEKEHLVDTAPYCVNRAAAAEQGPEICGVCKQEVGAKPWQLKRLQDCGTALRTVNARGMRDGMQSSTVSCAD